MHEKSCGNNGQHPNTLFNVRLERNICDTSAPITSELHDGFFPAEKWNDKNS